MILLTNISDTSFIAISIAGVKNKESDMSKSKFDIDEKDGGYFVVKINQSDGRRSMLVEPGALEPRKYNTREDAERYVLRNYGIDLSATR